MNSLHKKTFRIKTLGCKVNQYESVKMSSLLIEAGYARAPKAFPSDLYVINSCTVTHKADREVRRLIRMFHTENPAGVIAVSGCYVETEEDRRTVSAIEGVTYLIRNAEKNGIVRIVGRPSDGPDEGIHDCPARLRDRAFVKIQDGCNNRCAYCKIPLVRGPSRSRERKSIIEEIEGLVSGGCREVVLSGVCLGAWGTDLKGRSSLAGLVKDIAALGRGFRVRISSLEPEFVTDELIASVRDNPAVCRHFHISLQNGDDHILRRMKRKYTCRQFYGLVKRIRRQIPGAALTTDVIVGFPGEKEEHFARTLSFIKKIRPSRMHIFTFSRRKGTAAWDYNDTPSAVHARSRLKRLELAGHTMARAYAHGFLRKAVPVLIESQRDAGTGSLTGYSDTYIRVSCQGPDALFNSIVPVYIDTVSGDGVSGRVCRM